MKLKIFIVSIIVLLTLVAYKTYTETKTLKSINSYESCVAAKGSEIQTSYPATCITRLGSQFAQPINSQKYQEYTSKKYSYSFKYPTSNSPYDYSLREYENYERHDFGVCGSIFVGHESFVSSQITENIPFKYLHEISKLPIGQEKRYIEKLANNLPVEYIAQRTANHRIADYLWTTSKNISKNEDYNLEPLDSTYYLYQDNNLYLINLSANPRCQDYNQILSTFKFTD